MQWLIHTQKPNTKKFATSACESFFAGGCLGWSRAERPSVSWTKVLETLCLQQPKEMLNIKCVQKHAKGHRYQQSPNTGQRMQSLKGAQRRGIRWNPKESTYARSRMQPRKRALVKPEGSTYAGARSARERQERAKCWTNCKGWATGACESPQLSNDALKRKRKAQESSDTLEPLIMMLLGIMFTPRATLSR